MKVISLDIPEVKLLEPKRFGDHRGWFVESYSKARLAEAGIDCEFVQDNHSFSAQQGTIRALHYQLPPMAQAKLVRVTRGRVLDVAVDIRKGSPTFGQHVAHELSAENGLMMFIPIGFAHGFATLTPDVEFLYKVSNYYSPTHERGILWNDPALKIDWKVTKAVLSDRDLKHPVLSLQSEVY